MKTLLFEYGHKTIGSHNGKWGGQTLVFAKSKRLYKEQEQFLQSKGISTNLGDQTTFFHDFGDGWTAKVTMTVGRVRDFKEIMKQSKGFYGYDWMIDNILKYGRILTQEELKAEEKGA